MDPDPHLKSNWIQIRIDNICWIRSKKWMQIHSSGPQQLPVRASSSFAGSWEEIEAWEQYGGSNYSRWEPGGAAHITRQYRVLYQFGQ